MMFKEISVSKLVKDFFKVRGEDGNLDWGQVAATVVQILIVCATLYFLYLIGVI